MLIYLQNACRTCNMLEYNKMMLFCDELMCAISHLGSAISHMLTPVVSYSEKKSGAALKGCGPVCGWWG